MIFKGVLTALITPFKGNKIDFAALEELIIRQIDAKIDGIVIGGSTGEGSSLLEAEYYDLINSSTAIANKNITIIAGFAASGTQIATEKVAKLCEQGIDGIMCTMPHYVRPEQEGLYLHFKAVSSSSNLPIMIYINPGRTACDFADETLLKVAELDNIVAVKDSGSDLARPLRILPQVKANFTMMTGDDESALAYSANGGSGCVSVVANISPKLCKKMNLLWNKGDLSGALAIQAELMPFLGALFAERNPIGVKYALSRLGLCSAEIRLPLTISTQSVVIDKALAKLMEFEKNV